MKIDVKRLMQIQKRGGATKVEAQEIVKKLVSGQVSPEVLEAELEVIYKDAKLPLSQRITEYVQQEGVTGQDINTTILDKELAIVTEGDRTNRRQVLHRLEEAGVIEKVRPGLHRLCDTNADDIDVDKVDINAPSLDVKLPFHLHEYVHVYSKNIIVYAGVWDTGKTAMAIQTWWLNKDSSMPVTYFSSEMGAEELRERLETKCAGRWWKSNPKDWDGRNMSVIRPDHINIIDYIERNTEVYLIGEDMKAITRRLKTGVAVVCLQKNKGAELAAGKETTIRKPRIYLNLDPTDQPYVTRMTVVKAKNPSKVHGLHIKGWQWEYRITDGVNYEILSEPPEIAQPEEPF